MAETSIEERIARLEAVNEIHNLMGRMQYFISSGDSARNLELFALKTPGVFIEVADYGVYEGIEGLKKVYLGIHALFNKDRVGSLIEHDITTPVIEVARDGKTAKGVWQVPGVQSAPDPKTGKLQAYWIWLKYGADFIKEEGVWKIWHFHAYSTFTTPFDKGWIEYPTPSGVVPRKTEYTQKWKDFPADRPTTYHKPYSPIEVTGTEPVAPEPYETYK